MQTYLTPTKDVIQEGLLLFKLDPREFKVSLLVLNSKLSSWVFKPFELYNLGQQLLV